MPGGLFFDSIETLLARTQKRVRAARESHKGAAKKTRISSGQAGSALARVDGSGNFVIDSVHEQIRLARVRRRWGRALRMTILTNRAIKRLREVVKVTEVQRRGRPGTPAAVFCLAYGKKSADFRLRQLCSVFMAVRDRMRDELFKHQPGEHDVGEDQQEGQHQAKYDEQYRRELASVLRVRLDLIEEFLAPRKALEFLSSTSKQVDNMFVGLKPDVVFLP
ncbi:unnamed protein product [Amoebophrya sp. A25]|nr:unnamed protein product [Amoebophrya sp. A25]|eukprot:GSA25T00003458001.1